jgi:Rho-binding antiterminator
MEGRYKNIDCGFYDQLEAYATLKKKVMLTFLDEHGVEKNLTTIIKTLETKNKEEFLISTNGDRLRLDKLIRVHLSSED